MHAPLRAESGGPAATAQNDANDKNPASHEHEGEHRPQEGLKKHRDVK
jgi:hypothetical protein